MRACTSALAFLAASATVRSAWGHGFMFEPPARNVQSGPKNGYCPHCGNGNGICGDGNQWPSDSDYVNAGTEPLRTWTAGSVVSASIRITAHHKGHFEFSVCRQQISSSTADAQGCLDQWVLERATPEEAGIVNCGPNDRRGGCQPIDPRHRERWYLPPGGFSPDNNDVHTLYLKVPAGLSCAACTLQWRWWSANSCIPGPDYGCYKQELDAGGYNSPDWGLGNTCPGGGCNRCGCGEEFRNCADIAIVSSGGGGTTAPTMPPSVTTTAGATTSGSIGGPVPSCVSQEVLTCINGRSTFWPKCDVSQNKDVEGPAGYEYGLYCTKEWVDALNEMLSDPAVNKCNDQTAIHKLLAQVAYETAYFSTVYQPRDGGAGLIHMIPGNWPINVQDMDELFPGMNYLSQFNAFAPSQFQWPGGLLPQGSEHKSKARPSAWARRQPRPRQPNRAGLVALLLLVPISHEWAFMSEASKCAPSSQARSPTPFAEFLSARGLQDFIIKMRGDHSGILQGFVAPHGVSNSLVRTVEFRRQTALAMRTNRGLLSGGGNLFDRCATFEGWEGLSSMSSRYRNHRHPHMEDLILAASETLNRRIEQERVRQMLFLGPHQHVALHFKVASDGMLYFIFASIVSEKDVILQTRYQLIMADPCMTEELPGAALLPGGTPRKALPHEAPSCYSARGPRQGLPPPEEPLTFNERPTPRLRSLPPLESRRQRPQGSAKRQHGLLPRMECEPPPVPQVPYQTLDLPRSVEDYEIFAVKYGELTDTCKRPLVAPTPRRDEAPAPAPAPT